MSSDRRSAYGAAAVDIHDIRSLTATAPKPLQAADELDQRGLHDAAAALRDVTAEVLAADRRTARAALVKAQQYLGSNQHNDTWS